MKQNFLFFMCMLLTLMGWAQRQDMTCKFEVDEFTHDTTVTSRKDKLGKHKEGFGSGVTFLEAKVYTFNSAFVLVLIPQFLSILTIDKGDKVYIKFQDESVIELIVDETSISDHTTGEMFTQGSERTIWYNYLSFILTPEQVLQLESKKIVKVRCGYNDYETKGDQNSLVMDGIQCVKSTGPPKKKKK